jgi:CheY-like chemotaxis protein
MNQTLAARTATRAIRLVLVDDHAILRQGLRSVIEREDDLVVVGEASSEPEAEAVAGAMHTDVVLLDLKLSAASDFELRRASRHRPAGVDHLPRREPGGARGAGRRAGLRRQGCRHH